MTTMGAPWRFERSKPKGRANAMSEHCGDHCPCDACVAEAEAKATAAGELLNLVDGLLQERAALSRLGKSLGFDPDPASRSVAARGRQLMGQLTHLSDLLLDELDESREHRYEV